MSALFGMSREWELDHQCVLYYTIGQVDNKTNRIVDTLDYMGQIIDIMGEDKQRIQRVIFIAFHMHINFTISITQYSMDRQLSTVSYICSWISKQSVKWK